MSRSIVAERRTRPNRRVLGATIAVVATICLAVLAGCTASNDAASATVSAAATMAAAGDVDSAAEGPDDAGGGAASAPTAEAGPTGRPGAGQTTVPDPARPDPALANRQVIRTASIAFTERVAPTLDPTTGQPDADADAAARSAAVQAAAGRISAIGAAAGGYRGAVQGSADAVVITLRVPVAAYEAVMKQLGDLGTPEKLVESTSDVTSQVVDLDSRIKTMRAGVDRVRALLAEATEIGEIIAIESELTAREAELESLLSQQATLADQVALATITVAVTAVTGIEPVAAVAPVDRSGFAAGLASGWSAAKELVVWLAAVVGALLPFLPIAALVVVVVWWIRRRWVVTGPPGPAGPPEAASPAPPAPRAVAPEQR